MLLNRTSQSQLKIKTYFQMYYGMLPMKFSERNNPSLDSKNLDESY